MLGLKVRMSDKVGSNDEKAVGSMLVYDDGTKLGMTLGIALAETEGTNAGATVEEMMLGGTEGFLLGVVVLAVSGNKEGLTEGFKVGIKDGPMVDMTVGSKLGSALRSSVGLVDGAHIEIGIEEGIKLGYDDVGLIDGAALDCKVGSVLDT